MKICIAFLIVSCFGLSCFAACPSADATGDCFVDIADLADLASRWLIDGTVTELTALASQWLTEGIPEIDDMVLVFVSDPGVSGGESFNGYMSKYETTNAQYCQFLNAALASGDITVTNRFVYGASGSNSGADFAGQVYYNLVDAGYTYDGASAGGASRIYWTDRLFRVESGFENHPVTQVSWYGATAFCNYYELRLPTEGEWRAVADYNGTFTYGCGASINNSMANYSNSIHPDGTTPVGAFGMYGYGMADMTGNVWEWTSSCYYSNCSYGSHCICGGSWQDGNCYNSIYARWGGSTSPNTTYTSVGFRVCH